MSAVPSQLPFPPDKLAVAERLADSHRAVDPSMTDIYLIRTSSDSNPAEPIKLLEINPNTTASGIMPVFFAAHPASGITYPSIIVEVHPSEWQQLQQGSLQLPPGWILGQRL